MKALFFFFFFFVTSVEEQRFPQFFFDVNVSTFSESDNLDINTKS